MSGCNATLSQLIHTMNMAPVGGQPEEAMEQEQGGGPTGTEEEEAAHTEEPVVIPVPDPVTTEEGEGEKAEEKEEEEPPVSVAAAPSKKTSGRSKRRRLLKESGPESGGAPAEETSPAVVDTPEFVWKRRRNASIPNIVATAQQWVAGRRGKNGDHHRTAAEVVPDVVKRVPGLQVTVFHLLGSVGPLLGGVFTHPSGPRCSSPSR